MIRAGCAIGEMLDRTPRRSRLLDDRETIRGGEATIGKTGQDMDAMQVREFLRHDGMNLMESMA